jgi:hypothetical protein
MHYKIIHCFWLLPKSHKDCQSFSKRIFIPMLNPNFTNGSPSIHPRELELKETTETASSISFLDVYLKFDINGQLSTKFYDKRDDCNFVYKKFP